MKTSALLAPCCGLLLAACNPAAPPAAPEPPSPIVQGGQLRFPASHPQLALLARSAAEPATTMTVELPARLVWDESHTQRIYPSFAGRVSRIDADLGQKVHAGSVLASLASPDFGAAQADAAKAQADAELSRKALARQQELFDAGIAAKKDLEQAQADADRAAAELARARARVQMYGGAGAAVDQQLALRATLPGVVVERNLNPGQELRPDQSGPGTPALFVVSDPTTLWVQIDAGEDDVATVQPGTPFELLVPTLPGERFSGRITAVADFIDPATRTIKLRGRVDNPQRRLRAEMLASARFERRMSGGVVVPASALTLVGTQHWVYVEQAPGVFAPRAVKLAWQGPKQAVVSEGLAVGERVVSENLLLLARQFRLAQEEAQAPASAAVAATAK